jgi:hypothetical protein
MSLASFVRHRMPGYLMGRFHAEVRDALDGFLAGVDEGLSPRLLITAAPRHGKSELASCHFPAYAFGKRPDASMIATSHTMTFAARMNRRVKRINDSGPYGEISPGTCLPGPGARAGGDGGGARNSAEFEIAGRAGVYRCAGVGGGITGLGGDILIIDDPVKDREEADSPVYREKVWDWYTPALTSPR